MRRKSRPYRRNAARLVFLQPWGDRCFKKLNNTKGVHSYRRMNDGIPHCVQGQRAGTDDCTQYNPSILPLYSVRYVLLIIVVHTVPM